MRAEAEPDETYLNDLLIGFLQGNPRCREEFSQRAERNLRRDARRFGRGLPIDIQDEIIQQAYENLLRASQGDFHPSRFSARQFLTLMVRNANHQVRATYTRPGEKTRPRTRQEREDRLSVDAHIPSLDELEEVGKTPSDEEAAISRYDASIDVQSLLSENPNVMQAMLRMHVIGDTCAEVARDLSISRFQLHRKIAVFAKTVQSRAQAELVAAA